MSAFEDRLCAMGWPGHANSVDEAEVASANLDAQTIRFNDLTAAFHSLSPQEPMISERITRHGYQNPRGRLQ